MDEERSKKVPDGLGIPLKKLHDPSKHRADEVPSGHERSHRVPDDLLRAAPIGSGKKKALASAISSSSANFSLSVFIIKVFIPFLEYLDDLDTDITYECDYIK